MFFGGEVWTFDRFGECNPPIPGTIPPSWHCSCWLCRRLRDNRCLHRRAADVVHAYTYAVFSLCEGPLLHAEARRVTVVSFSRKKAQCASVARGYAQWKHGTTAFGHSSFHNGHVSLPHASRILHFFCRGMGVHPWRSVNHVVVLGLAESHAYLCALSLIHA